MYKLFSVFLSFYVCFSFASEYNISLLGTERIVNDPSETIQFSICGFNDKGMVCGGFESSSRMNSLNKMYVISEDQDIVFLENLGWGLVINNIGQIFGNGGQTKAAIWSRAYGVKSIDFNEIFDKYIQKTDMNNYICPIAFNDIGQLIGTYYLHSTGRQPFLWNNGVIYDMGIQSDFVESFKNTGYLIAEIELTDINNRGEIVGYFRVGKCNPKTGSIVKTNSYQCFIWDGHPHLIGEPCQTQPKTLKINNKGLLLCVISNNQTLLLDRNGVVSCIDNFQAKEFNDFSIILGEIPTSNIERTISAIWKEGKLITIAELLGVDSLKEINPPFSDSFEIEQILECFDINNKNQIACLGLIWGNVHPCILEPTSEQ